MGLERMVVVIRSPVKDMIINKAIATSECQGVLPLNPDPGKGTALIPQGTSPDTGWAPFAEHPEELAVVEEDFVDEGWPKHKFTGAHLDLDPPDADGQQYRSAGSGGTDEQTSTGR